MNHIIPTDFAKSKKEFYKKFIRLVKISKDIQIDFMDGVFVKAKSIHIEDVPYLLDYNNNFEAHLMVKDPELWIYKAVRRGFSKIIIHIEIGNEEKVMKFIDEIKAYQIKAFLAINPETPLIKLKPFLKKIDGVLIMGVHPGKEGQSLDKKAAERIKQVKKWDKKMIVQIDGGVNLSNIKEIAKSGIDLVNSGSFVSSAKDPLAAIKSLEAYF